MQSAVSFSEAASSLRVRQESKQGGNDRLVIGAGAFEGAHLVADRGSGDGEGWSDGRIIEAREISVSMVYRVRKQLVEDGLAAVLSRKARAARRAADFRRREGDPADRSGLLQWREVARGVVGHRMLIRRLGPGPIQGSSHPTLTLRPRPSTERRRGARDKGVRGRVAWSTARRCG
jgi:hypothetical protein